MKTALLVVDVQNDYFPGGRMVLHESTAAGENTSGLIDLCRKKSIEIIHVQHVSVRSGAVFFLPGTAGVEFHHMVKPAAGEKIIIKNHANSFRDTDLNAYLKSQNISGLVITGMMTHMCVDSTVRAAFDLGYQCILAADCCATRSLKIGTREIPAEDVQYSFLAALDNSFCRVMKKDDIIELLQK